MEKISKEKALSFGLVASEGLFDPKRDRNSVDQFGFVNLREAFESGSIPGNVSFLDEHCNGVVDPDDMMHRPKDNFERMRQADYVRTALRTAADDGSKQSSSDSSDAGTE